MWVDQFPNVVQPKRLFQTHVCVTTGKFQHIISQIHLFIDSSDTSRCNFSKLRLLKTDWLTDNKLQTEHSSQTYITTNTSENATYIQRSIN